MGKRIVGVDLFAGAGGLSLGAKWAGVDVRLAVEADPNAASTYSRNHPRTKVIAGDVRTVGANELAAVRKTGTGRILFGGPPCAGFSYSNRRSRNSANPKNHLYREFLRIVRIWTPDAVVFENVRGIADTSGGWFLDQVLEGLMTLGYASSHGILNAADFQVPQRRARYFILAVRGRNPISLPQPNVNLKAPTVTAAVSDLPILRNGATVDWLAYRSGAISPYVERLRSTADGCTGHLVTRNCGEVLERYRHVPQGGNWESIPPRLLRSYKDYSRCHTGLYHRLDGSMPAPVIGNFRKNMLIHPTQNRGLSVREAARIQSFPDWYQFDGSIGFQQQQVGNAVPPALASAVFARLTKEL